VRLGYSHEIQHLHRTIFRQLSAKTLVNRTFRRSGAMVRTALRLVIGAWKIMLI